MKELAQGIASLGRGPDTELVHMTKGEIAALQRLAKANGGSLTINPHTGLPEAGILSSILPMLAGAATMAFGGGPWGAALAGGLTGAVMNPNRPGIGGITGALGGYGGANLAGTIAGAGETVAGTEFAKQAASAGDAAFNAAMQTPVEAFNPAGANTSDLAGYDVANQLGPDAAATAQRQAAEAARAATIDSAVQPEQSYLDKLQKGISSPGLLNKMMKENKTDLMMAGAPLAASALGLGGGTAARMTPPGYGTSSSYTARGPRTRSTTDYTNQPGYGEKLYFSDTSLANYGANGGMASQQGFKHFALGGVAGQIGRPNLTKEGIGNFPPPYANSFADGGGVNYPDFNFAQPQMRQDPMQQSLNNYGEPEGYAGGGMPKVPARGPIRFNAENSGFFDQMPQRQAPAPSAGIPASGGYTPFSLYGPGGFKPAAAQVAPPTQAQATAAAPKPAEPAPAPAPTQSTSDWTTYGYMAEGGAVGYAQGGIADLNPTYAAGGKLLRGPGDGVSDSIPAVITGPKPQRAALADGEFVIPARIVSELGNGSTEAGARKLYAMMDRVQHARKKSIGKGKVAVNSKAEKLLPA